MLYQRRTFSCPASSGATTSEKNWDWAFLSREKFIAKYGEEPTTTTPLEDVSVEFHTDTVPATLPAHFGSTLVVTDGTNNS